MIDVYILSHICVEIDLDLLQRRQQNSFFTVLQKMFGQPKGKAIVFLTFFLSFSFTLSLFPSCLPDKRPKRRTFFKDKIIQSLDFFPQQEVALLPIIQ